MEYREKETAELQAPVDILTIVVARMIDRLPAASKWALTSVSCA